MSSCLDTAHPLTTGTPHFRPALHFTAKDTWLNDPNGLVFHDGLYHLFFQNNPYGNVWGNMSWGHATSPDLLHWTEHDVAISCDETEDIFSGSIVIDHGNTSGLGTAEARPSSPSTPAPTKADQSIAASKHSRSPTAQMPE